MFPQLFHKRSTGQSKEKDDEFKTFRTLMDARFDRLEQNFTALRTEWADVYDKIMHLYDRTRKRVKKAEVASDDKEDTSPILTPMSPADQREAILRAFRGINGRE